MEIVLQRKRYPKHGKNQRIKNLKILVGVIGYENVGKTLSLISFADIICPMDSMRSFLSFMQMRLGVASHSPISLLILIKRKASKINAILWMIESWQKPLYRTSFSPNCNIIIIILGQLTQEYQKLIERIIRNNYNKKIVIIHNFSNLAYVESVEEKIQRDIIEAFPVKEQKLIAFDERNYDVNRNGRQFIEERKGNCISHLVYAREETEAGNYYNHMTIDSMKMFLRTELKYQKFDLVDSFNTFCCKEKLKSYLSLENQEIKDLKMTVVDNHLKLNRKLNFKIRQGVFNAFGTLIIDVQENEFDLLIKFMKMSQHLPFLSNSRETSRDEWFNLNKLYQRRQ